MNRVTKTPRAEQDLIEHFARIALDKIEPAIHFLEIAEKTFDLLSRLPGMGRRWKSDEPKLADIRIYPLPRSNRSYLVFYRPTANGIEVIRILHGARDLDSVLEDN